MQSLGNDRNAIAMFKARIAKSRFIQLLIAQPIARRESRSKMTAVYDQPSRVQIQVMSLAHFWLGASAAKSPSSKFGAILNLWLLSIVALCLHIFSINIEFLRIHWPEIDCKAINEREPAHPTMNNIKANLFQFLSHARPVIAAKAETRLFFDMHQCDQIRPLSSTGREAVECPQTARADV